MIQLAKDILNKAIVVRKITSTKYRIILNSPNDIVLFLFLYRTRNLKGEFNKREYLKA